MESLPESFAATRAALHALAEQTIAPARKEVTGRIGLRATPGGFGTPVFGDRRRLRVDGVELVVEADGHEDRRVLDVDPDAARALADFYAFVTVTLEELARGNHELQPSVIQIWPEHFDVAMELGARSGSRELRRLARGREPPGAVPVRRAVGGAGAGRAVERDRLPRRRAAVRRARRRRGPVRARAGLLPRAARRPHGLTRGGARLHEPAVGRRCGVPRPARARPRAAPAAAGRRPGDRARHRARAARPRRGRARRARGGDGAARARLPALPGRARARPGRTARPGAQDGGRDLRPDARRRARVRPAARRRGARRPAAVRGGGAVGDLARRRAGRAQGRRAGGDAVRADRDRGRLGGRLRRDRAADAAVRRRGRRHGGEDPAARRLLRRSWPPRG